MCVTFLPAIENCDTSRPCRRILASAHNHLDVSHSQKAGHLGTLAKHAGETAKDAHEFQQAEARRECNEQF